MNAHLESSQRDFENPSQQLNEKKKVISIKTCSLILLKFDTEELYALWWEIKRGKKIPHPTPPGNETKLKLHGLVPKDLI